MAIRRIPQQAQTPPARERVSPQTRASGVSDAAEGEVRDPGPPSLPEGDGVTMRHRIEAMKLIDPEAAEKFVLDTIFQYMMTRTPTHIVAQRLGYSVGWVVTQREKVRARIKSEGDQLEARPFLVELLEQLKEVAAIGFREAAVSDPQQGPSNYQRRLRGAEVARNAIRDQAALLQMSGAMDNAPLRQALRSPDDDESNSANVLKQLSEQFLRGAYGRSNGVLPGDQIIEQT